MAKSAFRRIWTIFSHFSEKTSAVLPHTITWLMYCRYSAALPCSSAVLISAWQMVGLFPPLGQPIPTVLDAPTSESKQWPALCCQRNCEISISNVIFGTSLGCLWHQFVWSSRVSGIAALNGGVTSFTLSFEHDHNKEPVLEQQTPGQQWSPKQWVPLPASCPGFTLSLVSYGRIPLWLVWLSCPGCIHSQLPGKLTLSSRTSTLP